MEALVPSFMPPLAVMLAAAAIKKGSPLTEDEVNNVRDSAVCMMVSRDAYEQLQETREFRDVEPQNCWADWHRLKAQLSGQGFLPKLIMCTVGNSNLESDVRAILKQKQSDFTVDQQFSGGRDPRMTNAFKCCLARADPSFTPDDEARVANHSNVVYIVSENYPAADGQATCREMLSVVRALLQRNQSVAVKCESSGVTHGAARWLELAQDSEATEEATPFALFRAFVQYPIASAAKVGGDLYTCGLHLLGLPDLVISTTISNTLPQSELISLVMLFATYLIGLPDPRKFHSGHTFGTGPTAKRFRLIWEACDGYDEDDFSFNTFGRWRFTMPQ